MMLNSIIQMVRILLAQLSITNRVILKYPTTILDSQFLLTIFQFFALYIFNLAFVFKRCYILLVNSNLYYCIMTLFISYDVSCLNVYVIWYYCISLNQTKLTIYKIGIFICFNLTTLSLLLFLLFSVFNLCVRYFSDKQNVAWFFKNM